LVFLGSSLEFLIEIRAKKSFYINLKKSLLTGLIVLDILYNSSRQDPPQSFN
jgi:hypothetical protein